jgi:protein-S-isoprenylcysteine O-methyltransferase Ste14
MPAMTSPATRIHPLMRIPVPWLFILVFLAGVGLQYLVPLPIRSPEITRIGLLSGIALTVGGGLLALTCLGLFYRAHTTTVPFGSASKLVTGGPYRWSRNPMYVSLTLIYLGTAGIQARLWPLVLLPLLVAYLQWMVIPFEESRLRGLFGDSYTGYCARVRRWI